MRVQRVRNLTITHCKKLCKWSKLKFVFVLIPTFQDMSVSAKEVALGQLDALKAKCEEAVEARKKAEQDIETLRPVGKLIRVEWASNLSEA